MLQIYFILCYKNSKLHSFVSSIIFKNLYSKRFAYILKATNIVLRIPSGNYLCVAPEAQCFSLFAKSLQLIGSLPFISNRLRSFVKRSSQRSGRILEKACGGVPLLENIYCKSLKCY